MHRFNYYTAVFCAVFVFAAAGSCADNDLADYCLDYSYASSVNPIIMTKCAIEGCHNGDLGSSFKWTDFSLFQQKAQSGIVKTKVVSRAMPPPESPKGPLTDDEIMVISCWVDWGAKNN
jgi:hypothetical protein